MARNTEIKARVVDLLALGARVQPLADGGPTPIAQDDTFFHCTHGRLKLREFADGSGELIAYQRADQEGPKASDYVISRVPEPATLREALARSHGVRGRVRKQRTLYLVGQTRVHLDRVEGLGNFMELEVVLRADQHERDGLAIAHALMQRLGIDESTLLPCAYIDLLEEQAALRSR